MTDRPDEPAPGAEANDLPEGEPTAAPSPEGASAAEPESEVVAADDPGTDEEQGSGGDEDAEVDELGAMKSSLADLTNDLQRLSAEYANYRRRVDRERQLVAENAAFKALTPVIEVLDTIDRGQRLVGGVLGHQLSLAVDPPAVVGVLGGQALEVVGQVGERALHLRELVDLGVLVALA